MYLTYTDLFQVLNLIFSVGTFVIALLTYLNARK